MKNMKKYFAAAMSAAMVAGLAVVPTQAEEAKGSVYYLTSSLSRQHSGKIWQRSTPSRPE